MKLINRSKSKLPINWKSSTINSKDIENTAFRYRDLIINNGTKAFNIINDELKLPNIKSFKVRDEEINKSYGPIIIQQNEFEKVNSRNLLKALNQNNKRINYQKYQKSRHYLDNFSMDMEKTVEVSN